jgi:hypothetical protein
VRLVENDGVVGVESRIAARFCEQDAVGHNFDQRVAARFVTEPNFHSDDAAKFYPEFFGDPSRNAAGSDPAWLGVRNASVDAATELEAKLRELGALSGASLARDDNDLALRECLPQRGERV